MDRGPNCNVCGCIVIAHAKTPAEGDPFGVYEAACFETAFEHRQVKPNPFLNMGNLAAMH